MQKLVLPPGTASQTAEVGKGAGCHRGRVQMCNALLGDRWGWEASGGLQREAWRGFGGEASRCGCREGGSALLPGRSETSLFTGSGSLCKDREGGAGSERGREVSGRGSTCHGEGGHQLCPDPPPGTNSPSVGAQLPPGVREALPRLGWMCPGPAAAAGVRQCLLCCIGCLAGLPPGQDPRRRSGNLPPGRHLTAPAPREISWRWAAFPGMPAACGVAGAAAGARRDGAAS